MADDDDVKLSSSALAALQEFLAEQKEATKAAKENPFAENWALSQFWYDDTTAGTVAQEAKAAVAAAGGGRVACLACPSLFRELKKSHPDVDAHLFEYDDRFAVLGNFSYYDYKYPEIIPDDLLHSFTVVVADPPYLSEECLVKTLQTVRVLTRKDLAAPARHYLLTGAVVKDVAARELGLRPVAFRPQHKNKLGNEFMLYCTQPPLTPALGAWPDPDA